MHDMSRAERQSYTQSKEETARDAYDDYLQTNPAEPMSFNDFFCEWDEARQYDAERAAESAIAPTHRCFFCSRGVVGGDCCAECFDAEGLIAIDVQPILPFNREPQPEEQSEGADDGETEEEEIPW